MDVVAQRLPMPRTDWRRAAVLALVAALVIGALGLIAGSARRVPDPFGQARNGAIVYDEGGDILVRDSLDGSARTLLGGPTRDAGPAFAPDGARFMFVRITGDREHLWVADADGSGAHQALDRPLINASASWAPDSRRIAVITSILGIPTLLIVPVDGAAARVAFVDGMEPTATPAWRPPDGRELLIRSEGVGEVPDLFVLAADQTTARPLGLPSAARFGTEWDATGGVWSVDGSVIAYNVVEAADTTAGAHFRIHIVRPDGTGDRALPGPTDAEVQEAWPVYSPDGRWILVHRWTWQPDGSGWVAVMPADGSAPARDIGPRIAGGEDTGLVKAWSPDGSRVLVRARNTRETYAIDPLTGEFELLDWGAGTLPDWQRLAP